MDTGAAAPAAASGAGRLSELQIRRLRWRARRGLLENDLIVGRFLEAHAETLQPPEVGALQALLELPDNDLLDLLLARKEPEGALNDDAVRALLARLRAA